MSRHIGISLCRLLLGSVLVVLILRCFRLHSAVWPSIKSAQAAALAAPVATKAADPHEFCRSGRDVRRFLIFFSGHQGSSALMDSLSALRPQALVPGFEPLELGLSPEEKWAILKRTFNLPRQQSSDFAQWKNEMMLMPRVDESSLGYNHVMSAEAVGFKMRPYRTRGRTRPMRTGLSGISARSFEEVLRHCNVTIIATVRKNTLLQALSWYRQFAVHHVNDVGTAACRAHELQDSQFHVAAEHNNTRRRSLNGLQAVERRQTDDESAPYIDVRKFDKWLRRTQWANKELEKAIRFFDRPTMRFVYEEFLTDELGLLRRVAAFLGLPAENIKPSRAFFKNNDGSLRHMVENWEELCDHLMHHQESLLVMAGDGDGGNNDDHRGSSKGLMGRKAPPKVAGVAELCH